MFDHLVDLTEPICQKLDPALASMTIFDTSGIEAWVTENNPKYANRIIKQLKAFAKAHNFDKNYDPYKAAYGSMPSHAAANQAIQQMYINGHFCYAYKFGIITNGLGIVRDITFYNKDFLKAHPDIVIEKKSDSPDEDKSLADSKALKKPSDRYRSDRWKSLWHAAGTKDHPKSPAGSVRSYGTPRFLLYWLRCVLFLYCIQ